MQGCTKTFGFYCFPVSDRVENEMRQQVGRCRLGEMTSQHQTCKQQPLSTPPPLNHTQLKAEQEARIRAREAKLARLARGLKRQAADAAANDEEAGMDFKLKIRMFLGGLLDECPRCGEAMTCAPEDREGHRAHLQACKADRAKAKAYKERLQEAEVRFGRAGWVDVGGWLFCSG